MIRQYNFLFATVGNTLSHKDAGIVTTREGRTISLQKTVYEPRIWAAAEAIAGKALFPASIVLANVFTTRICL